MADLATLRDRTLEFPPPLAAGIVNVTDDSFFAGARSGTPEQAVADGLRAGRGGVRPARRRRGRGPQRPAGRRRRRGGEAGPGGRAPRRARRACRCSPTPSRPRSRAGSSTPARPAINDISAAASPEMLELVAERGCGYVLMHIEGPPRVDRARAALRRRRSTTCKAGSASGSRRAVAAGVARGADRARPRASTSTSPPTTTSRSCAGSASCATLGRPAVRRALAQGLPRRGRSRARGRSGCRPDERGAATLAAAALAVAEGAEMLRLHDVEALDAMRVAAAIARSTA